MVKATVSYLISEYEYVKHIFEVIDQTRGRVFPPISKHREVGWKNEAQLSFFNQLRGVYKSEETLFRVFDIASQTIDNSKQKFTKIL